jgi:hypothetical protein
MTQSPSDHSLPRVYFDLDSHYPGWHAVYWEKGKRQDVALSTWDIADSDGACAEAAELLGCPPGRVQVDEQ